MVPVGVPGTAALIMQPRLALALLLLLAAGAIAPLNLATAEVPATADSGKASAAAGARGAAVGASTAPSRMEPAPDAVADAESHEEGTGAAHLRRRLLTLHGLLLPRLKQPLQRGDARARRVMELLASVRSLGAELRAAGDGWAAGHADALSAASERVRGALQPAAERLREALRERCSDATFVPPTDKPAQIAGPGLTCTLTGASCRLVRLAAPTRRDLVLSCTEPSASEALVQPRYTSAYTAGATFTTSECKTDRQFGLGGTVSVDLWQPGSRPQDAVNTWRQVAGRLRQQAADAADRARGGAAKAVAGALQASGAGAGLAGSVFSARLRNGAGGPMDGGAAPGADGASRAAGRVSPLQRLVRPHSAVARALRLALSKHRERLTSAAAAWMGAHSDTGTSALLQQSAPAADDSSAARQGALRVGQALAALLADLGLEGSAAQLLSQLGVPEEGQAEQGRVEKGEGGGTGEVPPSSGDKAGGQRMQQSAADGGAGAGNNSSSDAAGGGVAGVFDLVGRTGLQALRAQLARAAAAASGAAPGSDGGSSATRQTARGGAEAPEEGQDGCGGGEGGPNMRRVAAELAWLAQM